jgi:hypothetical protein
MRATGTRSPRPKGISSMKRGTAPASQANRTRSPTSSSFTPPRTTVLTLSDEKPARAAVSIPCTTRSSDAAGPEMACSRSGRSVSSETFTREIPAARRSGASVPSRCPFVVRAISSIPEILAITSATRHRSGRSVGSPPVSRTRRTPSLAKAATTARISSRSRTPSGRSRHGHGVQ